jgi:hypothetical protein
MYLHGLFRLESLTNPFWKLSINFSDLILTQFIEILEVYFLLLNLFRVLACNLIVALVDTCDLSIEGLGSVEGDFIETAG